MQRYKPWKQKKFNFSLLTNRLCNFPFTVAPKVQNKGRWGRGGGRGGGASSSSEGYGTELAFRTGTWWGGGGSASASSWLEGLLAVAVLGGGGGGGGGGVAATEGAELVVEGAGGAACSSLGCLLANSLMLKTNWRQPSLM